MTPLRVLHGVLSLDVGGLERIVVDLVAEGRRRGGEADVVCIERKGALAPFAEREGAQVVSLDKPPGRNRVAVEHAKRCIEKLRPDVVHTHTIGALWYLGRAAFEMGGPPVVHTEHIDNVAKAQGTLGKWKMRTLWRIGARYCHRFCCVSEDVAASAVRWGTVPRAKTEVILNGIATERYADRGESAAVRAGFGIAATAKVVGTIGRLAEVKRQDLLLQAAVLLREHQPGLHLLIVGDGPERRNLESLADRLGLGSSVSFAGYQPDPERCLQAMDAFALTSRLEGLPLAMLEAWAAGLPVVSTAVGGVPKVIREGETGLLVPDGNAAALAAALGRVLGDPPFAVRLGTAGQAVVRAEYSLRRMAADYDQRYRAALESLAKITT